MRAAAWTSDSLHNASKKKKKKKKKKKGLHFKKAKFRGVHTEVYNIPNLIGTDGYELAFM